jgi:hypothetical protein
MGFLKDFVENPLGAVKDELTRSKSKTSGTLDSTDTAKARKSSIEAAYGNEATNVMGNSASLSSVTGVSQQNSVGTTAGAQVTEGGGQVTQTMVDSNAIGSVIDSILGNFKGLASVAQGEKSSGLYNSTAMETLSNNLLSQVSGKLAEIMSPTVTKNLTQTVSNTQEQRQAATDYTDQSTAANASTASNTSKLNNVLSTSIDDATSKATKKQKTTGTGTGTGSVLDIVNSLGSGKDSKGGGGSGILGMFG